MSQVPRSIQRLVIVLSCVAALLAAAGAVLAGADQRWYMLALSVVASLSAILGAVHAANRSRPGQAIACLCTGGVLGVAAVLSEPTLIASLSRLSWPAALVIAGVNVLPGVLLALGVSGALVALAGLIVVLRRPRESIGLFVRGAIVGLPVGVLAVAMLRASFRGWFLSLDPMILVFAVVFGGAAIGVLIAISGHCLIRAFEVGMPETAPQRPRKQPA